VFLISESQYVIDFFTEEEIRSIFSSIGAKKIQKKAIRQLSEVLSEIGISISKIALSFINEDEELDDEHVLRAGKRFASLNIPLIHNVWIISDNGTCLFSKSYSGLEFPDTIFSGLLLGISNMCEEVSGRQLERLVLGDMAIHICSIPPIMVAIVSDNVGESVTLLVKQLGERFLETFGHRLGEVAIDINAFTPYEHTIKETIRMWGIAVPSDVTGEGVQRLLDPDLIRESVIRAAQRKDLQVAIHELRQLPLFKIEEDQDLDSLIDKSKTMMSTSEDPVRKRGLEFIKEIFDSTNELKDAMRQAREAEGEEEE
jgi:hypothetical protein